MIINKMKRTTINANPPPYPPAAPVIRFPPSCRLRYPIQAMLNSPRLDENF